MGKEENLLYTNAQQLMRWDRRPN